MKTKYPEPTQGTMKCHAMHMGMFETEEQCEPGRGNCTFRLPVPLPSHNNLSPMVLQNTPSDTGISPA
jgi:hypothetical protein